MLQAKMLAPGRVVVEQVDKPVPSEGQVLVAVKSCGICGSDILAYKGLNPFVQYPNLFGHELVGEIAGLAPDVGGMPVGQRVAVVPFSFCGECPNCKSGRLNLCASLRYFGGLAEYIAVPAASIVPIPDNVSPDDAALLEPLAVAVHAVSRANVREGANVLILGAGAIGLCVLQVARARGAGETIVVDLADYRLRVACKLGAAHAVDAKKPGADASLRELCRRIPIEVIFECAGTAPTLETGVALAEKGARIVIVGTFTHKINLEIGLLQYREIDLITCSSYVVEDFREAIELLQDRRVDVGPLLSRQIPLPELAGAFGAVVKDKERIIKAVVVPGAGPRRGISRRSVTAGMVGVATSILAAGGNLPARQPDEPVAPTRRVARTPLLFFASDNTCTERTAAMATLAWLAAAAGSEFDAYMPVASPIFGAFTGNWHGEQFYFLANCFDLTFCSLSPSPIVQYRREAATFGARLLPHRGPQQLAAFYRELFALYRQPLPGAMVVIPAPRDEAGGFNLEPYCYADIFYRRALGVSSAASDPVLEELRAAGVRKAELVYCEGAVAARLERLGFAVETIDRVAAGDTYAGITTRIADRWLSRGKGIAFGNQPLILKMLPFLLRHDLLTLYEPDKWREFARTVGEYAHRLGNPLVWGNQTVGARVTDDVITEFSKYDVAMSLGVAICGPTVQEKLKLAPEWLPAARAPWAEEYGDDFLEQKAREGAVPVCYLLYAADLGHLASLPRICDIMASSYGRCGLAFPSTWYDFHGEALQQLYVPHSLGGVFPRVEPLVSSVGVGVGTEAQGFLTKKTQLALLAQAVESIKRHVGADKVPPGYLPWQDTCPYYHHNTAEPQFDIPREAGFEYSVTYKDEGQAPHIVHQDGNFLVLNKQNVHWRVEESLLNHTRRWEKELVGPGPSGWIIIDLDAPFWFQIPFYYDPKSSSHYTFEASVVAFAAALRYVERGGESGKLFPAKPHEVVRFARILRRLGRLER